jgi:hypothetical protein
VLADPSPEHHRRNIPVATFLLEKVQLVKDDPFLAREPVPHIGYAWVSDLVSHGEEVGVASVARGKGAREVRAFKVA